ncbi:MAG: 4-alpha-glucanotransferase [Sedimentisphaerales bacterium]|jgi:4-alpha-glucanotransferase
MTRKRASGLLLHITSLPSKYGIGDLGPGAYRFAEFLARAKQKYWQMLPLNPLTLRQNPYSPYNSISAFAGNTLLISPTLLYQEGLLLKEELKNYPRFSESRVEYPKVVSYKTKLLNAAYERFKSLKRQSDYGEFAVENATWLDDFALFVSLRQHFGRVLWCDWPAKLRDIKKDAIKEARDSFANSIGREKFLQYLFFKQLVSLKSFCKQLGIKLIGDIPIYVAYTSADVWSNPEIFKLTKVKKPRFIAGVPPDMFSRTGQLWGNPVYDWATLKNTRYHWWLERIGHNLKLFDIVRIDHFRGFFAYWQVPADSLIAANGKWVKCPYEDFFNTLFKRFTPQSIIAEDLGLITSDIKTFMKEHHLTGMRVLQFGFDGNLAKNPHWPGNHSKNTIVYTGTHDNNTAVGWFAKEANTEQKKILFACLGRKVSANKINWELIKLAFASIANLAIIPVQDVLGLGESARMNRPGTIKGNWQWRLRPGELTPQISKKIANLSATSHRA